jgi:uncharacterized protein with FMN-binding domain
MALTKEVAIDKIEVLELGHIQVREITRVMEDGKELSASYHRWSFAPGDDVSAQSAKVQAIANATWTAEVISAYQAMIAEQAKPVSQPTV